MRSARRRWPASLRGQLTDPAGPPTPPRAPQIVDFVKFEAGNTAMITKGRNTGRIGTVLDVEKHPGSFDIVHVKDAEGSTFATRLSNVFTIGKGADLTNALVSVPRGKGIKLDIFQQRDRAIKANKA